MVFHFKKTSLDPTHIKYEPFSSINNKKTPNKQNNIGRE